MNNKFPICVLHYLVEIVAVIAITVITSAALSIGMDDAPLLLGGIAAISGIAAYDIHQRSKQ